VLYQFDRWVRSASRFSPSRLARFDYFDLCPETMARSESEKVDRFVIPVGHSYFRRFRIEFLSCDAYLCRSFRIISAKLCPVVSRGGYLGLIICVILVTSFIFAVPVGSKCVPDGCVGCYVQYYQSISCQFVGIGDIYTSHINGGEFWFGCAAPVVP
jgi:hypothetical protein